MLASLSIKNYALISEIQISLDKGLNIITGETGAGKSIILDALSLCLGQRADSTVLFNSEQKCVIEAVFDIAAYDLKGFFTENDLDYERLTILRREITSSGKSRAFINDTPVKLKQLAELGSELIEIHSQYDNLQLFQRAFQFEFLDALSGCLSLARDHKKSFANWTLVKKELQQLEDQLAELNREREFNQFLYDELNNAQLLQDEEDQLEEEQSLLENAEQLIQIFQEAIGRLTESEFAVNQQLNELSRSFKHLGGNVSEGLAERIRSTQLELEDIANDIQRYADQVEINPERLEEVNERLALIFNLRSKHRVDSVNELERIKDALEKKLQTNFQLDEQIQKLKREVNQMEESLTSSAQQLDNERSKNINKINFTLNAQLAELGMEHSQLKLVLGNAESLDSYGLNTLEINLSSDRGEHFSSLKKAASGGELSRVNLIIKNAMAKHNTLSTSIFDEIDTGVSGEIARKVGGVMLEMANAQQIIAITHLPQIASLGAKHFFVFKQLDNGMVSTNIKELKAEDRIHEIAKMISGEDLTESALEQSKLLLSN